MQRGSAKTFALPVVERATAMRIIVAPGREPRRRRRGAAEPNCGPRAGARGRAAVGISRRVGGSAGPRSASAAAGGVGGGAAAEARSGGARAEGEHARRGEGETSGAAA